MKMTGDKWVAIWSVYCMVMMQISYWQSKDVTIWTNLLSIVLGAYAVHGTVKKGISLWKGRNENTETTSC